MAGYNSEYTLITEHFVFLDAKKATIPKTGITWGPYTLKEAAKAVISKPRPPGSGPKRQALTIHQRASQLRDLSTIILGDGADENRKEAITTFRRQATAAKKIIAFKNAYTVNTDFFTVKEVQTGFGSINPESTGFGAATTYNFACWFYTGGAVAADAVAGINAFAIEEIGAVIELHATATTLTRADTSRCLHESLVDTAFGGEHGSDDDAGSDVVYSYVSNHDPSDVAAASTTAAAKKKGAAAKKKGGKPSSAKTTGAVEQPGPKESPVNVYVNFAAFSSSANKCMIAYMQDQQDVQEEQPQIYVFYTVHAPEVVVGLPESVTPVVDESVSTPAALAAPAALPASSAVPSKPKVSKPKKAAKINDHVKFSESTKPFYRRAYVPDVLCDMGVTNAMEYLFSRICTDCISFSYYNAVTIIQTLMMGNTLYTSSTENHAYVSLNAYTDKVAEKPAAPPIDDQVLKPNGQVLNGPAAKFGSPGIEVLVNALQSIATDMITGTTSNAAEIASKIYGIDVAKPVTRDDMVAAVTSIRETINKGTDLFELPVKDTEPAGISEVGEQKTYMYARLVRPDDTQYKGIEFLVYMKRDDITGSAVTCFINLAGGLTGEITLAKSTPSGLTAMISYPADKTKHAITLKLGAQDAARALRLTQNNKITDHSHAVFKSNVQYQIAPVADVRAISIASAWDRHIVTVQTAAAAPDAGQAGVGEAFGRARARGMSRFV